MSEYFLQTELTKEARRELILGAEKLRLETEVENQQLKTKKQFYAFVRSLGLSLIIWCVVYPVFSLSSEILFYMLMISFICTLPDALILYFDWRKYNKYLADWKNIVLKIEYKISES